MCIWTCIICTLCMLKNDSSKWTHQVEGMWSICKCEVSSSVQVVRLCLCMWSVCACEVSVSVHVKCLCMWSVCVCVCEVSVHVKCLCMWSVCLCMWSVCTCEVSVHVKCLCMWSVCVRLCMWSVCGRPGNEATWVCLHLSQVLWFKTGLFHVELLHWNWI